MKVWELLYKILIETKGFTNMQVKVDGSIPTPLEDVFDIKVGKGFLLFCKKKKEE